LQERSTLLCSPKEQHPRKLSGKRTVIIKNFWREVRIKHSPKGKVYFIFFKMNRSSQVQMTDGAYTRNTCS
jgi:hypothetical protein